MPRGNGLHRQPGAPRRLHAALRGQHPVVLGNDRASRDAQATRDAAREAWIEGPLNNADLLPFGIYDRWKRAFARLFELQGGDWPAFLACASDLARMPRAAREERLQALDAQAPGADIEACPGRVHSGAIYAAGSSVVADAEESPR